MIPTAAMAEPFGNTTAGVFAGGYGKSEVRRCLTGDCVSFETLMVDEKPDQFGVSSFSISASDATFGTTHGFAEVGPGALALAQLHADVTVNSAVVPGEGFQLGYNFTYLEAATGFTWTGASTDLAVDTFVATLDVTNGNVPGQAFGWVDAAFAILDSSVHNPAIAEPWVFFNPYGGFRGDCNTPGAIAIGDTGPVMTAGEMTLVVSPTCGSPTFHVENGTTFFLLTHLAVLDIGIGFIDASHTFSLALNPNLSQDEVAMLEQYLVPSQGVPEPGAWALMIGGLGLAGTQLRRRRMLRA